jgi:hypothetical protein
VDVYSSFDLEVYAVLICDMLAKSDRVYGLVGEEDHIEIPMSMVARILTDMTAMGIVCPRVATA